MTERLANDEEKAKYTKKEVGFGKKKDKSCRGYTEESQILKNPDAVFVIDSHLETLAIDEAGKMGVTTVAVVDTNANPQIIDYPIPANDDATGSIKLITSYIIDAWIEGKNKARESAEKQDKEALKKEEKPSVVKEKKPESSIKPKKKISKKRGPAYAKAPAGK